MCKCVGTWNLEVGFSWIPGHPKDPESISQMLEVQTGGSQRSPFLPLYIAEKCRSHGKGLIPDI
jgi:hypothetical protein